MSQPAKTPEGDFHNASDALTEYSARGECQHYAHCWMQWKIPLKNVKGEVIAVQNSRKLFTLA